MSISKKTSSIDSAFPIAIPEDSALTVPDDAFQTLLAASSSLKYEVSTVSGEGRVETDESETGGRTPSEGTSTRISGFSDLGIVSLPNTEAEQEADEPEDEPVTRTDGSGSKFIDGLKGYQHTSQAPPKSMENKMMTENGDIAHRSTTNPLVDLFFELEEVASGPVVRGLLESAWAYDAGATLRIVFNARSIHLGKASRTTFYRCCGWLAVNHPKSLLANLQWVCRPVIEAPRLQSKLQEANPASKSGKPTDSAQTIEEACGSERLNDGPTVSDSTSVIDIERGLAHGYWKDLLNILALAVNGKLTMMDDPRSVLNIKREVEKRKHDWDQQSAKKTRDTRKHHRYSNAVDRFNTSPFYRHLHLIVARLFAAQLKADKDLLDSGKKEDLAHISLAAKWAPSLGGFHDAHTYITTSISEILYPWSAFPELRGGDRELYLKHARECYRCFTLGPLRKFLAVVERDITAKTYYNISYPRVPSLAMRTYSKLFIAKDPDRFEKYLDKVVDGKATISGATLLPSTLVAAAKGIYLPDINTVKKKSISQLVKRREQEMTLKVMDGQWATLVQRIKDSGTLESAIAVCDVSGSMQLPQFPDGTCPMDSSIGLSLLLAECTKPPFGGHFITFSATPTMQIVGGPEDKRSLAEKVSHIRNSCHSGVNTDIEAVFDRLILPMAVEQNLTQEEMVETVFVFSDMQFDEACRGGRPWSTVHERLKVRFKDAGYEMPKLVFWNLAGGRAGYRSGVSGDPTAPKPVTADEEGTALVSGYSQGQLKVFLDGAGFEDPGETIEADEKEGEDGLVEVTKKVKMDPLTTLQKAIGHPAYSMLRVVD